MHTFDLNLDWVEGEDAEALGSSDSDEELNGFIVYFLHGSDSDVSQSNQSRLPVESISRNRVIMSSRNEGMDLDFVELGLGLGLDSDTDTNNEAPFDLNDVRDVENDSDESFFCSMREVELACEEDFRVLVNESNTNNEVPFDLNVVRDVENESNEIQFDYNDAMMVDPPDEFFSNYNNEVDIEERLRMIINVADDYGDGDDMMFSWNNVRNEMVEGVLEQFSDAADDGDDDMLFSWNWNWNNSPPDIARGELQQFWRDFWPLVSLFDGDIWDNTYISWNMQTVTFDVDNLPSVTLTQEELNKNNNNSICAICMENFCIEEKLKRLPCFHYYHVDCISPWLRTRNTCPTCRYELPII